MVWRIVLFLWALCLSLPAHAADWLRAESEHYVVHADLNPDELRAVVQRMEDFHSLLQQILPTETRLGRKAVFFLEKDYQRISDIFTLSLTAAGGSEPEDVVAYVHFDPRTVEQHRFNSVFHGQARFVLSNGYFRTAAPWVESGLATFFATATVDTAGNDGRVSFVLGAPDIRRPWQIRASPRDLDQIITRPTWKFDRLEEFSVGYLIAHATTSVLMTDDAFSGGLERF